MKPRMSVATLAAAIALALLAGCGSTDQAAPKKPNEPSSTATKATTPSSPGPTPSVDSSSSGAIAIRGDWQAPSAEWIVHFEEDGTFTEDFQGLSDFRVGKYEVEGDVVRLIGDDGNTDEGKVSGSGDATRIAFKLGTLERQ